MTNPDVNSRIDVVHRGSRVRTAALAAMAAATTAMAVMTFNSCGEDPDTRVDAEGTMEYIVASRAQPIIEYGGKISGRAMERKKVPGFVPFLGGDEIPGTGNTSTALVGGVAEIRTDRDGISWKTDDKGEVDVTVNADKLYMQYSMSVQFKDGKPVTDTKQELAATTTRDNVLRRGIIAEEIAKRQFVSTCGAKARQTMTYGVQSFVYDVRKMVADGTAKSSDNQTVPPSPPAPNSTNTNPDKFKNIHVTFKASGPAGLREVDPENIKLKVRDMTQFPPKIIPVGTPAEVMAGLRQENSSMDLTPGGKCMLTGTSLAQLNQLSGNTDQPGV